MSERPPENMEPIKVSGIAIDRAMLDSALKDLDAARMTERVGEFGTKREFTLYMVMDTRSGRISQATMSPGEDLYFARENLKPDLNEVIITVRGSLTTEADQKGLPIEETMTFDRTDIPARTALSDAVRKHLQELLETWRESHNRYIVRS